MDCLKISPRVIRPQTCCLKVNIHCQACEKDVHKALCKVKGVTSILIDGENNEVSVSGTLVPYILVRALDKIHKRPEILWDRPNNNFPHSPNYHHHMKRPSAGAIQVGSQELNPLSHIDGLNQVELNQVSSTKTTFNHGSREKTEISSTNSDKITFKDGQSSARHGVLCLEEVFL